MQRIDVNESLVAGMSRSTTDANRLYSILLDARSSTIAETMFDIAEKMVQNEKENAKNALERLWALKKNMQSSLDTRTMDMLIQYYQSKIDILRDKEENIGRVSRDSRNLLEEKRKRDAEIASVKQEIEDCTREVEQLNDKLAKAKTKEQELQLIEMQLRKELDNNGNTVVNGLYEIIITPHESVGAAPASDAAQDDTDRIPAQSVTPPATPEEKAAPAEAPAKPAAEDAKASEDAASIAAVLGIDEEAAEATPDEFHALYQQIESAGPDAFPKSVVKTTGGAVIGEYFYDGKVYKNKRHYVFNSLYFGEQLLLRVQSLKKESNQTMHAEAVQMVADAYKRVTGNPQLHFEVSTNEIVNEKNLKELGQQLKERNYQEAGKFCTRLHAKIKAMSGNYRIMLKEQIGRFTEQVQA